MTTGYVLAWTSGLLKLYSNNCIQTYLSSKYVIIACFVLLFLLDNVKALFRRGKAHVGVWNLSEARSDFKRVAELDISLTKSIQKELKTIDQLEIQKQKEDKAKYQNLFR